MVTVALLCMAGVALGQSTNSGDIRGSVTDSTGDAVPGAKVRILNVDTGVAKDYFTNGAGIYDTVSILPGTYRITFAKEGFNTLVRAGITLEVGAPLTVDAQLTVGEVRQQVRGNRRGHAIKNRDRRTVDHFSGDDHERVAQRHAELGKHDASAAWHGRFGDQHRHERDDALLRRLPCRRGVDDAAAQL